MTSVLVPDILVATMRNLILLTYKDHLILTKKQMREVAACLTTFGLKLQNFMYDDNVSGLQPPPVNKPPPQRPPPQMRSIQQSGPNILQRQLGQPSQTMTSMNAAGKGMIETILGRPPIQQSKYHPQTQSQRTSNVETEGLDEADYKFKVEGYDTPNLQPLTQQQLMDKRLKQIRLANANNATQSPQQQFRQQQGQGQVQNLFKIRSLTPTSTSTSTASTIQPNIGNFRRIAPKPTQPTGNSTNMNVSMVSDIQFESSEAEDDDARVADPERK